MKLLIIDNLVSGYREGSIYRFVRAFAQDGDQICIRSTDGTTPMSELLSDASEYDLVVASGGDGTISAVSHALAYTNIPILPFPAGTANLLSLNLQASTEIHALANDARACVTRDFDLAEIEVEGEKHRFALIAGAGYDATIMKDAADIKNIFGSMAYVSAAFSNISPQVSEFHITLDGDKEVVSEGVGVLFLNFSKIQFDLPITHECDPQDGYLDAVILKTGNAIGLLPALGAAILDRTGEFPDRSNSLEIYQCKEAEVIANPPLQVQADGELIPKTTPMKIRVLPKAVKYVLSPNGQKAFIQ